MPRPATRIQPRRYEDRIPLRGFFGLNTFGPITTKQPDEFDELLNFDIYNTWIESRRGSHPINALDDTCRFPNREIYSGVVWDTGADEYLILQIRRAGGVNESEFWFTKLDPLAGIQVPTLIPLLGGGAFGIVGSLEPANMFVSTDRLFVIHPTTNKVIEWDGVSSFTGRPLGLPQPYITSVAVNGAGINGKYTYGIELVYQKIAGVDQLASGVNRQFVTTHIVNSITLANEGVRVVADDTAGAISGNTTWTHARLYRSFNQNIDYSDPTQPIDAQGTPEQLYSVVTVTRAQLLTGAAPCPAPLTFPTDLLQDGDIPADAYYVEFDRIDLSPLPNSYVGAYHQNRIFVTRAQGINDIGQSNVYYSNNAGTKYCEQFVPDQVIYCEPGDGQKSIKLISFEQDLIVIKEAKTGRLRDGNPDNGFETLDYNIGVSDHRMAKYIPKIGIAAIVNDRGDFRIFGYDLRWNNEFSGRDISRMGRSFTSTVDPANVSFMYLNGKLWVGIIGGVFLVLHVEQGKGWSLYNRGETGNQIALPYANNTKGLSIFSGSAPTELDKLGTTDDVFYNATGLHTFLFPVTIQSAPFQKSGREHLEVRHVSMMAVFENRTTGTLKANNYFTGPTAVVLVDPASFPIEASQRQRLYFLYPEGKAIGNYIVCRILSTAPCTIHDMVLDCFVDEAGWNDAGFDPNQVSGAQFIPIPTWGAEVLLHLTFDEP